MATKVIRLQSFSFPNKNCKVFQILKTIIRVISCCTKCVDILWDVGRETKGNKGLETQIFGKKQKKQQNHTTQQTHISNTLAISIVPYIKTMWIWHKI